MLKEVRKIVWRRGYRAVVVGVDVMYLSAPTFLEDPGRQLTSGSDKLGSTFRVGSWDLGRVTRFLLAAKHLRF